MSVFFFQEIGHRERTGTNKLWRQPIAKASPSVRSSFYNHFVGNYYPKVSPDWCNGKKSQPKTTCWIYANKQDQQSEVNSPLWGFPDFQNFVGVLFATKERKEAFEITTSHCENHLKITFQHLVAKHTTHLQKRRTNVFNQTKTLVGGFNPFEKILVKVGIFPKLRVKIENLWVATT